MTDLERVKQNGLLLEYVKKQTQEICLAAVQQTACALERECVCEEFKEICEKYFEKRDNNKLKLMDMF